MSDIPGKWSDISFVRKTRLSDIGIEWSIIRNGLSNIACQYPT
ncbi:hypothetical protein B4135_1346 [Caldibacillus debilis]|uniref:Uncharacterized protein n=1 Tax=Caldibacillus debilis TaxID=301148 RepID=A0A150MCM6_9BACI|nr:hypothetical protein B4135_1346 [Caldibacillus debilis]